MQKFQKGFSIIIFLIGISGISVLIIGGSFIYRNYKTSKLITKSPSMSTVSQLKAGMLSKTEIIQRVKALSDGKEQLVNSATKRTFHPQIVSSQNKLIEVGNMSFIAPWSDYKDVKQQQSGQIFRFSSGKIIAVLTKELKELFKEEDLNLELDQFLEKYKLSSGYEISLQEKALSVTLNALESANSDQEANELYRLFLIKNSLVALSLEPLSIVQTGDLIIIEGGTTQTKMFNLQDKEGNYYTILAKFSPEDTNLILSTLKVKSF